MAIQIQLRRGTSSTWATSNPLLAQGELGVELDTSRFKVGDGITYWNSLTYASGVTSLTELPEIDDISVGNPENGDLLQYDSATSKWIATSTIQTLVISSTATSTSSVTANAMYVAGGLGISGNLNLAGGLNAITDIQALSPVDGSLLIYQSNINKWVASINLTQQNMDAGEF